MIKALLDFIISLFVLVLLLPLFLLLALLIKLDSKGPVFYRGRRIGQHGRPFRIFKFRTMIVNADRVGGPSTKADDARLTRAGKFIKRYNLDELAQFINILKGQMSIVGPRPEVEEYVRLFAQEEKQILSVKPGITDWATIWISDEAKILEGASDPEKVYLAKIRPDKLRLQLDYVKKHSLGIDLLIMLKTLHEHLINRIIRI